MTKVSAVKFPVLRQITCGPYTYLLRMILIGLVLLSAARLGLVLWLYDRVAPTDQLGMIFLQGIRADLILLCIWSAIPVLLSLCWARPGLQHSWFR